MNDREIISSIRDCSWAKCRILLRGIDQYLTVKKCERLKQKSGRREMVSSMTNLRKHIFIHFYWLPCE